MAKYNDDQLFQYFKHVSLPGESLTRKPSIEFLRELHRRQVVTVPFEGLALHYSKSHLLSLDPGDLFKKVVERNMGGYCMEMNHFFGAILRSLGFAVMSTGARLSHAYVGMGGEGYLGWCHMVNLVKIDGKRYFVDVAFGSDGPAQPMLLESGYECAGAGPQRQRLDYKALPIHSDPDQRVWVYSCRRDEADEWKAAYSFVEVEFFPQDFEVINLSVMTRPQSFFKQHVVCTKMLEDPETKCLIGNLSLLNGEVRRRVGHEITVLEKFISEGERVAGLEKWFGIVLTEEEKKGIIGLATEVLGTEGSAIDNL